MFLYNSVLTYYLIKMKNTLIVIFLIASSFFSFGQSKKVNNYKYVIVPQKFGFLKHNDQYQTSSLTKFLLKKNGFIVMLDSEEYPSELKEDPCKAINAAVVDKSSMFKTSLVIELRDCFNKVIYTSKEGDSRIKNYKKSYQEAIRRAHASMANIKYEASENNDPINISKKPEIVELPTKIKKEVSTTSLTPKKQIATKIGSSVAYKVLYAQPKENGFQLINSKPEVVFFILNSKLEDVFIIKDKNGLLYKNDSYWVAEFYENGKLLTEKYQIKF